MMQGPPGWLLRWSPGRPRPFGQPFQGLPRFPSQPRLDFSPGQCLEQLPRLRGPRVFEDLEGPCQANRFTTGMQPFRVQLVQQALDLAGDLRGGGLFGRLLQGRSKTS
jgi:hypothetical protein